MKQRLMTFVGIVAAMVVAIAGVAVASEVVDDVVGDDADTKLIRPPIEANWDDDNGAVVISVGLTDDEMDPCEGVTLDRGDEDELLVLLDEVLVEDPDTDLPGCLVYDGAGKDGKVSHGTMQSAVARNLSPHDLDVPKGWIMRVVAKEKPMKKKAGADDPVTLDELDGDEEDAGDGPGHGKAKGRDKAKGHDKADKAKAKNNKGVRGG